MVPQAIVAATAAGMATCGAGRRECVTYWLAPAGTDTVVESRHPRHSATSTGYEVEGAWLNKLFLELVSQGLRLVAQVHTHPGTWVGHSGIDDGFAALPTAGFISIVVPLFAARGIHRSACGVYVLSDTGAWNADRAAVKWT